MQRVRVHVPDRPGVLSGSRRRSAPSRSTSRTSSSTTLSPERGGTLNVLVAARKAARRAADLLEAQGYSVIVSPAFE